MKSFHALCCCNDSICCDCVFSLLHVRSKTFAPPPTHLTPHHHQPKRGLRGRAMGLRCVCVLCLGQDKASNCHAKTLHTQIPYWGAPEQQSSSAPWIYCCNLKLLLLPAVAVAVAGAAAACQLRRKSLLKLLLD